MVTRAVVAAAPLAAASLGPQPAASAVRQGSFPRPLPAQTSTRRKTLRVLSIQPLIARACRSRALRAPVRRRDLLGNFSHSRRRRAARPLAPAGAEPHAFSLPHASCCKYETTPRSFAALLFCPGKSLKVLPSNPAHAQRSRARAPTLLAGHLLQGPSRTFIRRASLPGSCRPGNKEVVISAGRRAWSLPQRAARVSVLRPANPARHSQPQPVSRPL